MFRLHVLLFCTVYSQFFFIFPQGLNWSLSPITVNSWLNIYLQLSCLGSKCSKTSNFNIPNYSQQQFVQVTQVCIKYSCCYCRCTYNPAVLLLATISILKLVSTCTQSGISHSMGSCVLTASELECQWIISINAQLTSWLILGQHKTNNRLTSWLILGWKSVNSWPSVDWPSIECWWRCQLIVGLL